MQDILIIGGGPAGLSAGIYSVRGGYKTMIIEKDFIGGQASQTYEIENYPGFENIGGVELMMKMAEQATNFGVEIKYGEISKMNLVGDEKSVTVDGVEIKAKVIILATGAKPKKLGLASEERFTGRGVSYCATCDGGFYKNKIACVVGGGNTAVEDALYLAGIADKVYLVHRRDELRASAVLAKRMAENEKIEFVKSGVVTEIIGENAVEGIKVESTNGGDNREIKTNGIFVAIGNVPTTADLNVEKDEFGYILTNEKMETTTAGVFACGDARKTPLRQVVTAAADGAIAGTSAIEYLMKI